MTHNATLEKCPRCKKLAELRDDSGEVADDEGETQEGTEHEGGEGGPFSWCESEFDDVDGRPGQ